MTDKKQVTKDTMRQKRGKKSHEVYMKMFKEDIQRDNQLFYHFLHR